MAEKTALERYLTGEPLNEELAAIQKGVQSPLFDASLKPDGPQAADDGTERELTNTERADLRDVLLSPGWPVMHRVFQKLFANHRKSAITLSQTNPLANRDRIAEEWAYEGMFRRAAFELLKAVEAEVRMLEKRGEEPTQ